MTASRLIAVMRKELLQLKRDRVSMGMMVGIPVMQLLLFGYAINFDVRNLGTAVADEANTHLSRQFVAELAETQVLTIRKTVGTAEEIEALLRSGEISVGVYIPHDFDRRVLDPNRRAAQLMVDGADSTIANVATQLRSMPIEFDTRKPQQPIGDNIEVRTYYNPEGRTAVNIVPGLIGVIITLTMLMFTAVSIVREREHGNIELLINTPISTTQLMVGKIAPYIMIGLLQLALTVVIGSLLFQVPFVGAWFDLYFGAAFFIVANLALGLLLSTMAKTQFQAMQMTFFVLLPSILLSGFVFPFDGMPAFARWIGEVLPITHFIRITRGVMLRGAEVWEMGPEIMSLAAFSVIAMTVAVRRFSRRLD